MPATAEAPRASHRGWPLLTSGRNAITRRWARTPNSERIAWLIIGIVAIARTGWALWAGVQRGNDSVRYQNPQQWWRVFDISQLMGPGQLLQVLALPGAGFAIAVQTLVAGLGWGWAALSVTRGMRGGVRWPLATALLALGLTPWWLVWDTWMLTESLTTTGCVMFAAGLGQLLRTEGQLGGRLLVLGAAVALLTRPLVVPLVAGLALVAFLGGGSRLRRAALATPRRRLVAAAALLGWSAAQMLMFQHAVDPLTPRANSIAGIQAADRFLGRAPAVASYVPTARQHGMPACPLVESRIVPGTVHHVRFLHTMPCRDFQAWLDHGGLPWPRELAAHPTDTLGDMLDGPWTSGPKAALYGLPDRRFQSWNWYPDHRWSSGIRSIERVSWWVVAASALALLVPGRRWPTRAAMVLVVAGWCAGMWLVDGIEYWRHLLPGFTVLPWLAASTLGRTPTPERMPTPTRTRRATHKG